jgi:Cap4 SAVED domain
LASKLFKDWLEPTVATSKDVPLFKERTNARATGMAELGKLVADHFVGEKAVLKMGGYKKAAKTILNSLPTSKRTQSGDLGELIATEYVDAQTSFRVPLRKLRWKSDRQMPMHGNDVIAVETLKGGKVRILKGESKSAATVSAATVRGAVQGLDRHEGRPNPSTLAFIVKRLYDEDRDAEAKVFEDLQADGALATKDVQHLIFTLAGNDPSALLAAAPKPKKAGIKRLVAAVVISDHRDFVEAVYAVHGAQS